MAAGDKKQARSRRSPGALLIEVFFIVLGVMVALAANEWRESRALDQRTTAALQRLTPEAAPQ